MHISVFLPHISRVVNCCELLRIVTNCCGCELLCLRIVANCYELLWLRIVVVANCCGCELFVVVANCLLWLRIVVLANCCACELL